MLDNQTFLLNRSRVNIKVHIARLKLALTDHENLRAGSQEAIPSESIKADSEIKRHLGSISALIKDL